MRVYLSRSKRVVPDLAVPHVVVRRQTHRRAVRLDEPPSLRRPLHTRYKEQSSVNTAAVAQVSGDLINGRAEPCPCLPS